MSDYHDYFGIGAGLTAAVAYILLIIDIIRHPEKDKSLTAWIIWCIVGIIIFKSFVIAGNGKNDSASWVPLVYAIGPFIILPVLVVTSKEIKAKFFWLDKTFLVISCLSGIYLWYFHEGLLPLIINMTIDGIGSAFVVKSLWREPGTESGWVWTTFALGTILNAFAIREWKFENYAYPLSIVIMCVLIAYMSWRKPK